MRFLGFLFGGQNDRIPSPNTRSSSLFSPSPSISSSTSTEHVFRNASSSTDPRTIDHDIPHPPARKRKLGGPQDRSDAPTKKRKTLIPSSSLSASGVADRHSRASPRQMGPGAVAGSMASRRSPSQAGTIGDGMHLNCIRKHRPSEPSEYGESCVSGEETSLAELHREVGRLEKIIHKQLKKEYFLKEALAESKKVSREQGDKIDRLNSAGKKFEDQLSSIREHLQCRICLEALTKPHILPPCGHVFCQACLQNWFQVVSRRTKKCPCCRSKVLAPPVPVFVLKNLLSIVHPEKQENSQGFVAEPWVDIFPRDPGISEGGASGLIETDDDSTSDDDDDAGTETDGTETDADDSGTTTDNSDTDADTQDDDERSSSGDEQVYGARYPSQVPASFLLLEIYLQLLREDSPGREFVLQTLRRRRQGV